MMKFGSFWPFMWDYVILEIYGQICVIWIVYVSLSVFKW